CLGIVLKSKALSAEQQAKLAEEYGAAAVVLLRRAYQERISDPLKWEKQASLAPLRNRADFQALMADIRKADQTPSLRDREGAESESEGCVIQDSRPTP